MTYDLPRCVNEIIFYIMRFSSSLDHVVDQIQHLQRFPQIISFWIEVEVTSVSLCLVTYEQWFDGSLLMLVN